MACFFYQVSSVKPLILLKCALLRVSSVKSFSRTIAAIMGVPVVHWLTYCA